MLLSLSSTAILAAGAPARRSLQELGRYYGFPSIREADERLTLESRFTTLEFFANSRKLLYNGTLIWLNDAAAPGSSLTIAETDARAVIDPLLRTELTLESRNVSLVVLDPGHGGEDSGAVGRHRRVLEKDVVLDVARRARDNLAAAGIRVRLTRSGDRSMPLARRTQLARRWGADLFVSIHLNSSANAAANGIETFVLPAEGFPSTHGSTPGHRPCLGNQYDAENTILAYYLHRAMLQKTSGSDRGIKRARFDVLCRAHCPAVLVECGFVSNRTEETGMLSRVHRDRMADAVSEGILRYIGKCGK